MRTASPSATSGDPSIGEAGVASPCTGVCTMDIATHLCVGCARTLDEIAAWSSLAEHDRRAILDTLPERRSRRGS